MRLYNRSRILILMACLSALTYLVLPQVHTAQAAFNDVHMYNVLLRVESELMQKTPAGQYYEAMFWKHGAEICQIMSNHPENNEKTLYALRLFTPSLEALVDGDGDTVRITSEQITVLKEQLVFLVSVGSPALREDIEKEQHRLQLDRFIGMTMSDAWEVINSKWTPDTDNLPQMVPGTDEKWAYYIHDGIYLEYPKNYMVQKSGSEEATVYFVPSSDIPGQWNASVIRVRVLNISGGEVDSNNPYSRHRNDIVWEKPIQSGGFTGIEFIANNPDFPVMYFHAYLYNEENRKAVDISVFVNENPQLTEPASYQDFIYQRYEYFQHMVERLQIQLQ